MKKILMLAGLALCLGSSFKSEAQVRINVQIGAPVIQQSWYDVDDDYYYMPDQGVYYNVRRQVYVYPYGGNWVYGPSLPSSYGGYTYRSGRYYRINGRAPFMRNDYYRGQYPVGGYRGGGYRRDDGYRRHDNGNHNGWYKNGNGRGGDRNDNRGRRGGYDNNSGGYRNNGGSQNNGGWNNGGNGRPDRR
jgi:hypothetical protein